MGDFFQQKFEKEFVVSEKLRATILAGIFLFAVIYAALSLFFMGRGLDVGIQKASLTRMLVFLLFLFKFEATCVLYFRMRLKRGLRHVPLSLQYGSAIVEITTPSVIMLLLAAQMGSPERILHSPTIYIYFIFIILSTLRLNYRICICMGVLAALEFLGVSLLLIQKAREGHLSSGPEGEYFVAITKAVLLFLSSIGAAFVAYQIKININRSLLVAEHESRVVNLFGQQVSKEIVDEMLQNDGRVQSKRMQVCVMFIDIRNFTAYVADKTPDDIVRYQNAFFSIVIRVVQRHKGIINQFLGDGCMVTFGAPVSLENPGLSAVRAAIDLRGEIAEEVSKQNLPPTRIGVGLHTGQAVTGNIGTEQRQQYSVTGTVVILASRIEQLNKELNSQILASEEVVRQIQDKKALQSVFMGNFSLKGWSVPVGLYKIA
jgi:adenylate cyclase